MVGSQFGSFYGQVKKSSGRSIFFIFFVLFWQLVLYVGKYINEIQDVIFPYFFKIQFFPFLTFLASLRNNLEKWGFFVIGLPFYGQQKLGT